MKEKREVRSPHSLRLIAWALMLVWTVAIAISLVWNWRHINDSSFDFARLSAQSQFEKDLIYSRWAAMHGGVYVTPTPETPPDPYLAHIKDRDLVTSSGKRLTLINPAYMTRQVHELGNQLQGVKGHITSLNPIRPENQPDSWERQALLSFEKGATEMSSMETLDKELYLRFMRPLTVEKTCLTCHEQHGDKLGDIRGGISISVPFEPFRVMETRHHSAQLLGHGVIGMLGLLGIWVGGRRLQGSQNRLVGSLQEASRLADRNRLLLSSLGEGVYGTDNEGECIFINPAALTLLGYDEEEVVGRNQHQLFHSHHIDGEDYPCEECPVYRTLQDGKTRKAEDAFRRKSGQTFPVSLLVKPILKEGVIDGVIVSFRDISEQKKAQQALINSSAELRRAQAVAHVGSWRLDIATNGLNWSEETYRMFGIPQTTPITLEIFVESVHPDDREKVLAAWQVALQGGTYDIEHRILVDGQTRWMRERAEIRFDAEHRAIDGIGTVHDITRLKENALALSQSEQRMRSIIHASPVPKALVDGAQDIIYLNPAFIRTFGYRLEDIPTLSDWWTKAYPDSAYREQVVGEWHARVERAQDGEVFEPMEVDIRCEDGGMLIVHAELSSLANSEERLSLLTLFDITQQHSATARLQTLLDTASDGIHILDEQGNLVEFSHSFSRMLGYTAEEIAGLNVADWDALIPGEKLVELVRGLINEPTTFETIHRRKDGSLFEVEINAKGVVLNGTSYLYASSRDISERKALEASLSRSEERFRDISESTNDWIWEVDSNYRYTYISKGVEDILGYTEEDMLGKTPFDFMAPQEAARVGQLFADIAAGKRPFRALEHTHLNKAGCGVVLEASGLPILGPDGELMGYRGTDTDITERKRMSEALLENERRYRALVEASARIIWSCDPQGNVTEDSPSWREYTGQTFEQFSGLGYVDCIHPDDCEAVANCWRDSLSIGQPFSREYRLRHHSGDWRWNLTRSVPLKDQDGTVTMWVSMNNDIHKQRRAEQAEKLSKERFQYVFDGMSNGAAIYAPVDDGNDYVFKEINKAVERIEKVRSADLIGKRVSETFPGVEDFGLLEVIRRVYRTGQAEHFPLAFYKDGRISGWRENYIFKLSTSEVVAIYEDVTERKQNEEELQSAMNRLRLATKAADLGIWSLDLINESLMWDERMQNIYLVPEEVRDVGITLDFWKSRAHPDDLARVERELAAAIEDSRSFDTSFRILLPDQSIRHIQSASIIEQDKSGRALRVVGINRDISELMQAESALRAAKEAADAASRAKSEFIANMSHEIRTPMNAIIGLSDLGLGLPELTPRLQDYLKKILTSSKALLSIINDILDFSKIEARRLELDLVDFDLEEVMRNVTDLFGVRADERNVELVLELAPSVPQRLRGDPLRLGQVMNNLVGNAMKFTEAGEVHIQISRLDDQSSDEKALAKLRFSVRDSGIGISPTQLDSLFEPFQQADGTITRRFGGTGLGLTISRHLVQRMGGELQVESELGQGSCFSFVLSLPVVEPDRMDLTPGELCGTRALVVDDLESSRQTISEILTSWQIEVEEASSGPEALERLVQAVKDPVKPYKVILLDWKMPEMDGVAVAKRVHELVMTGEVPQPTLVMMATAGTREQLLRELPELQQASVLTKPVTSSLLFDAIMDARGGNAYRKTQDPGNLGLKERAALIRGARVLLVEDNDTNQTVARHMLERIGLEVTSAWNGRQALTALETGTFDVVLMDLHMPEMDGLEACRQIRAHHRFRHLPIIAMTAAVMEKDRSDCEAAGMNAHLAKPIDSEELLTTLLRWIEPHVNQEMPPISQPTELSTPSDDLGIPGIDSQTALGRLGGDLDLYHAVLRPLPCEYEGIGKTICNDFAAGNRDGASRQLHKLRGALGNIGAQEIADQTLILEEGIKSGDDAGIDEGLRQLDERLMALFTAIEDYVGGVDRTSTQEGDGLSPELDPEALKSLVLALKQGDLSALEQFKVLTPAIDAKFSARHVQDLHNAMDRLEFPQAVEILDTITQTI